MNKIAPELTLEQLMEIAKNPLPKDEFKDLPPVKRFILSEEIKQGVERIPAALVYDRYLTWAKNNKLQPISSVAFFREFKLTFTMVKTYESHCYLLSPKGFDLSPEKLMSIKLQRQRKGSSNGKKTTEKT